jgi:hypothetical protein
MAGIAMPYLLERLLQYLGETQPAFAIALEQVKRHALRRFRTDARQAAQGIDQLIDEGAELHGDQLLTVGDWLAVDGRGLQTGNRQSCTASGCIRTAS